MEAMEKLADRERRVQEDANKFKAPTIRTVADIQFVLNQLDPGSKLNKSIGDVAMSVDLQGSKGERADGQTVTFRVNSKSGTSTHRDIIIEGIQILKRRGDVAKSANDKLESPQLVVNDREMNPPHVLCGEEAALSIDPLISRLLGGYRNGRHICWDLEDGYTYKYEIFEHRLTRKPRVEDRSTAVGSFS
jgi:hypothetical protein